MLFLIFTFLFVDSTKANNKSLFKSNVESQGSARENLTSIATEMRTIMNTSVDPCFDFYQFACGNFSNTYPLKEDLLRTSRAQQDGEKINNDLRSLFEEPENSADPHSTKLVKTYYKSCLNIPKLEELGLDPLKALIKDYGGWPVVNENRWNESEFDWIKLNALLTTSLGMSPILSFLSEVDAKNTTKRVLSIDQPSLCLSNPEYYLNTKNKAVLDGYFQYMVSTAVQLGATEGTAKKQMLKVLEFETALAEVAIKDEDRRDQNAKNNPVKIKNLKEEYPMINFSTWFDTTSKSGWSFDDSDTFHLTGVQFVRNLSRILTKSEARTLANYEIWFLVMANMPYLAPSLRNNSLNFKRILAGIKQFKPRWQECMENTIEQFTFPVGAMFVKKYFNVGIKQDVEDMTENIRRTLNAIINESDWMDPVTKQNALKKLNNMESYVAYPLPDIFNETWIMKGFEKAKLSPTTFFDNHLSILTSRMDRTIREYHEPLNKTEWAYPIATINAGYNFRKNRVVLPAGILMYSYYNSQAPKFFNYGRIGTLIGHEISHGFDDQGMQYDLDGNVALWWSNETLVQYKKKAKCFVNQYSNIKDAATGFNLRGGSTQGENIADNGGLKLAYKAFQDDSKREASNFKPTFSLFENFTSSQLFFLSYAQNWCTNIRTEGLKLQIHLDEHSPNRYRVTVPLQNNDDFAAAFNCPVGSPMNPKETCQLW